jgi:2-amino-4-hydroxy-6-hydroxymethyldihydropteridine diphosphokinase
LQTLAAHDVRTESLSRLYRTPAWPDPSEPAFVNAVASVETPFSPRKLLQLLHETETAFGRTRSARNAPRTLDLDLIDYQGRVERGPPMLPHPRMATRGFVLIPLADVAPGWRHPLSGLCVTDLIAALPNSERHAEAIS